MTDIYQIEPSYDDLAFEPKTKRPRISKKFIGKLCWAWNCNDLPKQLAILYSIAVDKGQRYYETNVGVYVHCQPALRSEIEQFMPEK